MDNESYVREILNSIRDGGLESLQSYSRKFDRYEGELKVTEEEFSKALNSLSEDQKRALDDVIGRVRSVHSHQKPVSYMAEKNGSIFGIIEKPLERVGIYVPGGKPLPSSLIMAAVPALLAGVEEVAICSPPRNGAIEPAILYIAHTLGLKEVYKIGGAQAVAAMAFGVGMKKVRKIFGPGSAIVTEAKRQVYGMVGIDGLNGPSEICVIADSTADPDYVRADLSSQLEHGPDSRAWLLTTSREISEACSVNEAEIEFHETLEECVRRANELAAEHLEILTADPLSLLDSVKNAGAIYLGPYSPVPAGDYFLGVNHVLPTGGSAVFASALTVWDFMKRSSFAMAGREDFKSGRGAGMKLAEMEGMKMHRKSMEVRK